MDIGVVGLGLIGGSMAKTIRRNTPHTVLGTDADPQVMYKARLLEAIDGDLTDERLAICDIVFIATWPRAAVTYVQEHAAAFKKGAWVIDLCGVKRAVCGPLFETARENGFTFIGGHPMAGIEYWGFDHATATLFDNASMILTPPPGTDIRTLSDLKHFFRGLGFGRVVMTTPEEHDRLIGYTSQLAHVVSSAYVKSPEAMKHPGFSAGSFKDMTRVARLSVASALSLRIGVPTRRPGSRPGRVWRRPGPSGARHPRRAQPNRVTAHGRPTGNPMSRVLP